MKIATGTIVITPGKVGSRTAGLFGVAALKRGSGTVKKWEWFPTLEEAKASAKARRRGPLAGYRVITLKEWL